MRALFLAICLAPCVGAASAAPPRAWFGPDFQMSWAGVYCETPATGRKAAGGTTAGFVEISGLPGGRRWSQLQVPAQLGVQFGVIVDSRRDMPDVVLTVLPPGSERPDTWTRTFTLGHASGVSFAFDQPEELRAGRWVMEAHDGDRLLYHVEFDVFPEASLPEIAQECRANS